MSRHCSVAFLCHPQRCPRGPGCVSGTRCSRATRHSLLRAHFGHTRHHVAMSLTGCGRQVKPLARGTRVAGQKLRCFGIPAAHLSPYSRALHKRVLEKCTGSTAHCRPEDSPSPGPGGLTGVHTASLAPHVVEGDSHRAQRSRLAPALRDQQNQALPSLGRAPLSRQH